MCGFWGCLESKIDATKYCYRNRSYIDEINALLKHRGPDDSGTWYDEK